MRQSISSPLAFLYLTVCAFVSITTISTTAKANQSETSVNAIPQAISLASVTTVQIDTASEASQDFREEALHEAVYGLDTKNFKSKALHIESIANSNDSRAADILQALEAGLLFKVKDSGVIAYSKEKARTMEIFDALSSESIGTFEKRALSKIRINNRLRRQLRGMIAALELRHPNEDRRNAAIETLLKSPSAEKLDTIELALQSETNSGLKEKLMGAQAMIHAVSGSDNQRISGITFLGEFSHKAVRPVLMSILTTDEKGEFVERNTQIIEAAQHSLDQYESKERWYQSIEHIFFGLSSGSVLLLIAVGLAITFGVMGVINMAHGEMIMLGAYTTYVIQLLMPNAIEYSLLIAIPAAFLVSGLVGIAIERGFIRFLYGRPLETLLATFGISLILQQLVREIFSPLNRSVTTPDWMSGSWEVNGMLSLTFNRLYIILFSLAVLGFLFLLLKRSRFGLQMRAVTMNRPMASSMGIRTGWVDALTFGLGSGIAGIAGVAVSQLTNVGPNLGQAYIIDSFMVVVFGGVGNLLGTFFGAFSLGIANKFAEPFAGAVLAKILILVAIILFIQRRPQGMFALKGRAAEGH